MFKGTLIAEPGEVMPIEVAIALGFIELPEVEAEEENIFDKSEEIR